MHYNIIRLEALRFLNKNYKKRVFSCLQDVCIVRDSQWWINKFIKLGIPRNIAEDIFKLLIYSNSRDLLDCPFYKIGDLYIVVPSIAKIINASKSMLSNLNNKGIEISYKGDFFENYLANIIKEANCKHTSFKKKVKNEPYQCDLIFEIEGDVFFVEAKNISPISSFHDYDKNIGILKNACDQLNRIADYIINFECLTEMLGIPEVKSIQKLIVSSIPIGKNLKYNDVIITDEIYFSGYFQRRPPMLHHIDNSTRKFYVYRLYSQYYSDKISKGQFLELLNLSPLQKSFEEKRIGSNFYCNEQYKFSYEFYDVKVDSLSISGDPSKLSYRKYV